MCLLFYRFSIFIILVVFSFACGTNQLYWYYAQMVHSIFFLKQPHGLSLMRNHCSIKIQSLDILLIFIIF